MPRATPLQAGLNAGEFSPRMAARTDFERYPLGCSVLENFLLLPQGGAARRPGTRFVAEVKDSATRVRLVPFVFSTVQAYMIEAGDKYFRFYKDQGRIVAADTSAAIANGSFGTDIASWINRSTGSGSIAWNAAGYLALTGNGAGNVGWAEQGVTTAQTNVEHVVRFRVIGLNGDAVRLRIGTTSTGSELVNDRACATGWHTVAFTPTASLFYLQFRNENANTMGVDDVSLIDDAPLEIATPYGESDLASIHFAQSADTLYLVHPKHAPLKLGRSSHATWSLTPIFFADGPYQVANAEAAKTLAPSATGGAITITASGHAPFAAADVGRLVRIRHGTSWGYAEITGFTSTTVVSALVRRAFGSATASPDWKLGSWSATTGFPQTVGFFEQRLCFAATSAQPQTLWFSQSADFENMQPDNGSGTIADDDALDYTIASEQVNVIRWLAAGKNLLVGTLGGEWRVTSSGPLVTPTDIDVKQATSFGSANRQAIKVRGRVVYLQRARRKLFEFIFDFNVDNFASFDQTLLAEHITKGGIGEFAYQQELDSVLWCVRDDGQLATLTFQPEQKVVGWSRQVLGGAYRGGAAVAESVAAIPSADADEIWLAAKRTIGNQTRRYVEVLTAPFETGDDSELAVYADSSLSLDAPKPITNAARADPVRITAPGHGFSNGDGVRIEDVVGMTGLNRNSYTVANADAGSFDLAGVDGTGFAAYIAGGEVRRKVTTITGLGHLEGESVKVYADGAVHPDRVVAGGQVTLDAPAAKVVAGLGYRHVYESLKWEAGSATGTAQGQVKRIDGVTLVLLEALNAHVGPAPGRLRPVPFRAVGDPMDQPVPLYTGEKFIEFDGDYALDTRVRVEGSDPVPFTLLAIAPNLKTNSR
jgi:hypothetical protein